MKVLVALIAVMGLLGGAAAAQSTEAEISARLIGKPLQLRGFWIEDKLAFDAAGNPEKSYKTGSFTESGFAARTVTLHGTQLEIEGDRIGLVFNTDEMEEDETAVFDRVALSSGNGKNEPVKIQIDGGSTGDFTQALDAVFVGSVVELAPSVPDYWKTFFLREILHVETSQLKKISSTGDGKLLKIGGGVRPPVLIKNVDASFSKAARGIKFSGKTLVAVNVDATGLPQDIQVTRPVGLGLDEQAVKAVSQYRFKPATKNGVPVRVQVSIEVNFQIFD